MIKYSQRESNAQAVLEKIFQAMPNGADCGIRYNEFEIRRNPEGHFLITLNGETLEFSDLCFAAMLIAVHDANNDRYIKFTDCVRIA